MAKRFILKSIGSPTGVNLSRKIETNLLGLSAIGIKWNTSLIKQMRGEGAEETASSDNSNIMNAEDRDFLSHSNIAGQNDYIAFFDQTYQMRRDFLRKFALQGEINDVLETIADETIVNDDMHYFAYPATRRLKSIIKAEHGKELVDGINLAYRKVYHMFHFNEGNDAWHYTKKFLVDGFLAFEIIYASNADGTKATDIIGFQELDPITLQPEITVDSITKQEIKVWIQYKGDANKQRILPDTNVIYISWAKNNFISHLSYCERLIHSFNMLRTLENSRVIWNVQNAQRRVKIVVPVGTQAEQKMKTRLRQLEAQYKEDINIDNMSGEITVNGQPKFPFAKIMVFPSKEGSQTEVSELEVEGHDLNSTEQLKWFWQRFMIETRLPKDRFNMIFDLAESSAIPDSNNLTREEYKFSLFINRIRDIYKEILLKPTWIQFSLTHPEFAKNLILKNSFGLEFVEENVFALAKQKSILDQEVEVVQKLASLQTQDQSSVFSMKFLLQKYLSISDDDWSLNQKMLEDEKKKMKEEQQNGEAPGIGGAPAFGGSSDFGGDFDRGGDFELSNFKNNPAGGVEDLSGGSDLENTGMPDTTLPDTGAGPGELPQATPPQI